MSGRICPNCDREITASLYRLEGLEDSVDIAGADFPEAGETDYERADVSGVVRLSCSCSYYDIDVEGSVSAFNLMPQEWDYGREVSES